MSLFAKNVSIPITASVKQLPFRSENAHETHWLHSLAPKVVWMFTLLSLTLFSCFYVPVKSGPCRNWCFMCDLACWWQGGTGSGLVWFGHSLTVKTKADSGAGWEMSANWVCSCRSRCHCSSQYSCVRFTGFPRITELQLQMLLTYHRGQKSAPEDSTHCQHSLGLMFLRIIGNATVYYFANSLKATCSCSKILALYSVFPS